MAFPANNSSDSSLTHSRHGLTSLCRTRSKVKCPGLLLLSPGNNNNNGESRRRLTTASNSRKCSVEEGSQSPSHLRLPISLPTPVKDEDMKGIMTLEVSNSVNEVDRRSPTMNSSFLARVDPILDFWMVDEELRGTFRVCSTPPSTNHSKMWHQQAMIFKIKTTSPYNFFVRPICGLMRPNVVTTVEVKCERRSSHSRLEMDEFLVEIAPVPGAIAGMTNDLYTTAMPSNFPELMAIWERIDQETTKGSYDIVREFHRVSCRFHRTSQDLSVSKLSPRMKEESVEQAQGQSQSQVGRNDGGLGDNNNFPTSDDELGADPHSQPHLYENCSFTQPTQPECYLARESSDPQGHRKDTHPETPHMERSCSCSSKVRKLQISNFLLALLLMAALIYICCSHFYYNAHDNDYSYTIRDNISTTNNDKNNLSIKIKKSFE